MQRPTRPTGITILAILDFLVGILLVLAGGLAIGVSGSNILASYGYGFATGFVAIFGGIVMVVGLFAILVGWGMWTGKSWAWILAVVLYAIGALFSLASIVAGGWGSIVSLLIEVLLLWYLFRPHVKAYFGMGGAMQQAAPMQSTTT